MQKWSAYAAALRGYAETGVAFDFAENELGIHCVAAPVRDAGNGIVAAISVASPAQHMPEARMRALAPEVAAAARAISNELGWNGQSGQQQAPPVRRRRPSRGDQQCSDGTSSRSLRPPHSLA